MPPQASALSLYHQHHILTLSQQGVTDCRRCNHTFLPCALRPLQPVETGTTQAALSRAITGLDLLQALQCGAGAAPPSGSWRAAVWTGRCGVDLNPPNHEHDRLRCNGNRHAAGRYLIPCFLPRSESQTASLDWHSLAGIQLAVGKALELGQNMYHTDA